MVEGNYHIDEIGHVRLVRNSNTNYLRLKLHPVKGTTIIAPAYYTNKEALDFLLTKKDWILEKKIKMDSLRQKNTIFKPGTAFNTYAHQLELQTHQKQTLKCQVKQGAVKIWFPENVAADNEKVQSYIRHVIEATYRLEAKQYVPARVKMLAGIHGYTYQQVRIKNTKTRWGSCSGKGNLNFSLHIMRLPEKLRDYLILHELTHTAVPNHSKQFWEKLAQCLPTARQLDKELRHYHLEIW